MIADPAQILAGQLAGQRIKPVRDPGLGFEGAAKVFHEHLAGPGVQVVGAQAVQVERRDLARSGVRSVRMGSIAHSALLGRGQLNVGASLYLARYGTVSTS